MVEWSACGRLERYNYTGRRMEAGEMVDAYPTWMWVLLGTWLTVWTGAVVLVVILYHTHYLPARRRFQENPWTHPVVMQRTLNIAAAAEDDRADEEVSDDTEDDDTPSDLSRRSSRHSCLAGDIGN